MQGYIDEKSGYLCIKNISDGVFFQSNSAELATEELIDRLETVCIKDDAKLEILEKQLKEEREKNDKLCVVLGALYDKLDLVRKAHYLRGYTDGAWTHATKEVEKVYNEVHKEADEFPKQLEVVLSDIKALLVGK